MVFTVSTRSCIREESGSTCISSSSRLRASLNLSSTVRKPELRHAVHPGANETLSNENEGHDGASHSIAVTRVRVLLGAILCTKNYSEVVRHM
jgi:hypothetical protein